MVTFEKGNHMPEAYLSSGQLAILVGRSRETIRRYELLGVIPPGRRDPINGCRYWTPDEASQICEQLRPVVTGANPASDPALGGQRTGARTGDRP